MRSQIELSLTPEELQLILLALGQMPYVRVHELIGRIQSQVGPQLLAAAGTGGGPRVEASAPGA